MDKTKFDVVDFSGDSEGKPPRCDMTTDSIARARIRASFLSYSKKIPIGIEFHIDQQTEKYPKLSTEGWMGGQRAFGDIEKLI